MNVHVLLFALLAQTPNDATPTPAATSYAEAVAAGMAILVFICGAVWFVMTLMNSPIKEKLAEAAKEAKEAHLELERVKRDVANHSEKTEKMESDLKENIKSVAQTVEKIDAKVDSLLKRS